jgi:mRNA interferase MazF
MGLFTAGQVVTLPFPYTDLSPGKLRPVLLLARSGREDWIVCQITSNPLIDAHCIAIDISDFVRGGLRHVSYVRPTKLFTAHESLIVADAGVLTQEALKLVQDAVVSIIQGRHP